MDFYLILAFIATCVVSGVGVYVIQFLRNANRTLEKVDILLDQIHHTTVNVGKTAEEAETTAKLLNTRLPGILEDFGHTAASARAVCQNTEIELRKMEQLEEAEDNTMNVAANIGNYVLKGYSVWKKLKRNRFLA